MTQHPWLVNSSRTVAVNYKLNLSFKQAPAIIQVMVDNLYHQQYIASSNPAPSGDYNTAQAQVQQQGQGDQPYYGVAVSHAQQQSDQVMMTQVVAGTGAGPQPQQEQEVVGGNAASAGAGGETGVQMAYDNCECWFYTDMYMYSTGISILRVLY